MVGNKSPCHLRFGTLHREKRKYCTRKIVFGSLSEEWASAEQLPILCSAPRMYQKQQFVVFDQFPLPYWSIKSRRGRTAGQQWSPASVVFLKGWPQRARMTKSRSRAHMWGKCIWIWPSLHAFLRGATRTQGPRLSCWGWILTSGLPDFPTYWGWFFWGNEQSWTTYPI